jgi:hypothetical protein
LEIGIFLMLVPWSAVWERNYFLDAFPSLRPILLNPAVKGAVAGLGLANVYVGLSELFHRWVKRRSGDDAARTRENLSFRPESGQTTAARFDSETDRDAANVDGKFLSSEK